MNCHIVLPQLRQGTPLFRFLIWRLKWFHNIKFIKSEILAPLMTRHTIKPISIYYTPEEFENYREHPSKPLFKIVAGFGEAHARHYFYKKGYEVAYGWLKVDYLISSLPKKWDYEKKEYEKRLQKKEEFYSKRIERFKNYLKKELAQRKPNLEAIKIYRNEISGVQRERQEICKEIKYNVSNKIMPRNSWGYGSLIRDTRPTRKFAKMLGRDKSVLLHALLSTGRSRFSFPDFIAYKQKPKECFFAEIKAIQPKSHDRLFDRQKVFISEIKFIHKICDCQVIYVIPEGRSEVKPISWDYEKVKAKVLSELSPRTLLRDTPQD